MRSIFSVLLPVFLCLSLMSCQQEVDDIFEQDNPPGSTGGLNGDFRAKFDGVQWVADKASSAHRMNGRIALAGMSLDKKTFVITLTDSGVHRYTLNQASLNAGALVDSSSSNPLAMTTNQSDDPNLAGGEVNITAIDEVNKTITGTFTVKLHRQIDGAGKSVTEGSFNLKYVTTLPPSSTTDTLTAKVNNVVYTPTTIVSVAVTFPSASLAISSSTGGSAPSLGFQIPSNITPGSYTLDLFGATYMATYNAVNDGTKTQAATSGTLVILEHNITTKRIRGTFNFHAENILDPTLESEITDGYFSVKY